MPYILAYLFNFIGYFYPTVYFRTICSLEPWVSYNN